MDGVDDGERLSLIQTEASPFTCVMFERSLEVATPTGQVSIIRENIVTSQRKNHLSWSPVRSSFDAVIIVGDSYADDVDMGFQCWPTRLAQQMGRAVLNTSRGDSKSWHARAQLKLAHEFLETQPGFTPSLLIIHTGGNNMCVASLVDC